jgi:hypothetical protein
LATVSQTLNDRYFPGLSFDRSTSTQRGHLRFLEAAARPVPVSRRSGFHKIRTIADSDAGWSLFQNAGLLHSSRHRRYASGLQRNQYLKATGRSPAPRSIGAIGVVVAPRIVRERIANLPAVREIGSPALHLIRGDGQRKAATFEVSRRRRLEARLETVQRGPHDRRLGRDGRGDATDTVDAVTLRGKGVARRARARVHGPPLISAGTGVCSR